MRLRNIMIVMFCSISIAPIGMFWFWPYSQALESEISDVRERHLVIAKNLAGEMKRYYIDLISMFEYLTSDVITVDNNSHLKILFENLGIRHICIADVHTGVVKHSIQTSGPRCPLQIPSERFKAMKKMSEKNKTILSGVYHSNLNGNVFYLLRQQNEEIYIGAVTTKYIVELGQRVAFGKLGHAAIVDQNGRAIAHPRADWVRDRFDMSRLGVVQKMLANDTGVEIFFSPALKAEMVAGYTHVNGPGWGVMVPQPLSELSNKASDIKQAAVIIMMIGLVGAIILAFIGSSILIAPLERLVAAMQKTSVGDMTALSRIRKPKYEPIEMKRAREAIAVMATSLKDSFDTISQHAYIDSISGLPNRECFRLLSKETISSSKDTKGAMLFLDLDGFKMVNDVYGHRVGDQLLLNFATELNKYCKEQAIQLETNAPGVTIFPARLGGDEFVVLLSGLPDYLHVRHFAKQLFSDVFGKYKIHNGVQLNVSGSVGGALFPAHADNFDELLRLSDIAMYNAKKSGKGCFHFYKHQDRNIGNFNQSKTSDLSLSHS